MDDDAFKRELAEIAENVGRKDHAKDDAYTIFYNAWNGWCVQARDAIDQAEAAFRDNAKITIRLDKRSYSEIEFTVLIFHREFTLRIEPKHSEQRVYIESPFARGGKWSKIGDLGEPKTYIAEFIKAASNAC